MSKIHSISRQIVPQISDLHLGIDLKLYQILQGDSTTSFFFLPVFHFNFFFNNSFPYGKIYRGYWSLRNLYMQHYPSLFNCVLFLTVEIESNTWVVFSLFIIYMFTLFFDYLVSNVNLQHTLYFNSNYVFPCENNWLYCHPSNLLNYIIIIYDSSFSNRHFCLLTTTY